MSGHVAVVTDSAACLPAELASHWGVSIVPLQVVIDGEPFSEGEGIGPAEVVAAVRSGRKVTTSQPTRGAFHDAFTQAADAGASSIVAVTLSGAISGTSGAAMKAADDSPVPVTVVDSRTVSLASGLAALSAAVTARAGSDAAAVAAEARRVARSALCLFTVETLEYLRRGGRVSPAVAAVGHALNIRPVLGVVGGEVVVVERVRSSAKARAAMLDRVASRAPAMRSPVVGLMTLDGESSLALDAASVLNRRGHWPVLVAGLSAVLAVHAGPGTLAAVVADVAPEVAASLDVVPS